jgi:hypothetical protein
MRHLRYDLRVFLMNRSLRRIVPAALIFSAAIATAAGPVPAGWATYNDMSGSYSIHYPPDWQVLTKGNAVVITSPGDASVRGVFGITPRAAGVSINESVDKEFSDPNRAPDLQRTPARLANIPAIKVWGSKKGNTAIRIVEYYVQIGNVQYYILFQAPHAQMQRYGPTFDKMIGSLRFQQS